MKNQIALPANQAKQSRISLWLNRENVLFSSIMDGWPPLPASAGLPIPSYFARKEVCDE